MKLLRRISQWYFTRKALPYWGILAIDSLIVVFSTVIAFLILNPRALIYNTVDVLLCTGVTLVVYVIAFKMFHTFRGVIRYSSFVDLQRIIIGTITGAVTSYIVSQVLDQTNLLPHAFLGSVGFVIVWVLTTLLMWLVRIVVKYLYDVFRRTDTTQMAFIYGVKAGGVSIAKSIRTQDPLIYDLKGFVNPDANDYDWLQSVRVYPEKNIVNRMKDMGIKALLVSPLQTENFSEKEDLINELLEAKIKIMMFSQESEWDGKSDLSHANLHEIAIEDLLPRQKIEVDMKAICELLTGRRILITGAAGSIGSEMVRQIASFGPDELVLIDQAETPMHDVRLMMASKFPKIKCSTIVTSITNQNRMEVIFSEHKPEYVFHAAAYKHVPMMEDNPSEAVQNNIYGTRVIADLAVKYGTRKFVMISTDKAVNPTNVMGCSKRICEIYCQSLNKAIADGKVQGVTQFVTTRFGNVLGSNGSVIPIFKDQIAKGGPVTVTDPNIVRFFMLISEACKLVLEAGTLGNGGEIFVFDMGKPVKIVDLAKKMIRLSGAQNIEIKYTGLRQGEKLYEEVLADEESTRPTVHPKIKVASVIEYPYEEACRNEERLLEASYKFDDMATVKVMKEIVPEFISQESRYEVLDA